jgi:hypothetical protein
MHCTVDKADVISETFETFEHVWDIGSRLNGIETADKARRLIIFRCCSS